jgi:hypothetical protein
VTPRSVETMGSYYGVTGRRYDQSLLLAEGDAARPQSSRVIARVPLANPKGASTLTVVLGPGGTGAR